MLMRETFALITSTAQMGRRLMGKGTGGAVTALRPLSLAFAGEIGGGSTGWGEEVGRLGWVGGGAP